MKITYLSVAALFYLAVIAEAKPATTKAPNKVASSTSTPAPAPTNSMAPANGATCNAATILANAAGYPTWDTPPPPVASWTALVDWSKVPNIPVRANVNACSGGSDPTCAWSCTGCVRPTDVTMCKEVNQWGLSFDDGPTSAATSVLLPELAAAGVTTSFFCVGSRVIEFPDTLCHSFAQGHQIGVHTWSHSPLTTQTNEVVVAEIKWTEKAIMDTIGVKPLYMRPPYGDIDDRVRAIMAQLGYKVALWAVDTNDFTYDDGVTQPPFQLSWMPGNFSLWAKEYAGKPGPVSLDHDLKTEPVREASQDVQILQQAGFKVMAVASCQGDAFYANAPNPSVSASVGGSTVSNGAATGSAGSTGTGGGVTGTGGTQVVATNSPNDASKNFGFAGAVLAAIAGAVTLLL